MKGGGQIVWMLGIALIAVNLVLTKEGQTLLQMLLQPAGPQSRQQGSQNALSKVTATLPGGVKWNPVTGLIGN